MMNAGRVQIFEAVWLGALTRRLKDFGTCTAWHRTLGTYSANVDSSLKCATSGLVANASATPGGRRRPSSRGVLPAVASLLCWPRSSPGEPTRSLGRRSLTLFGAASPRGRCR